MLSIDPARMTGAFFPMIQDSEGCDVMWCEPVLTNEQAVSVVQQGLPLIIKKHGVSIITIFFNSLNDSVSVFDSSSLLSGVDLCAADQHRSRKA